MHAKQKHTPRLIPRDWELRRLHEAAPDLLAACQAALAVLTQASGRSLAERNEAVTMLVNAIRKATE